MGDPRLAIAGVIDEGGRREHLVVVDPFVLDAHEVTVGALRASGVAARDALGRIYDPREELGVGTVCTFRSAPSENDALPVTCVSHRIASAFCASLGKRLPTEAELERVASNGGERPYVWGFDVPACGDAAFGHGDAGPCGGPTLPSSSGQGARDRVSYGGVEVVDLAGNVAEWAQDRWNRDEERCFPAGVLENPLCTTDSTEDGPAWVARGTSFRRAEIAPAALRLLVYTGTEQEGVSDELGFRCARSTIPPR